MFRFVYVLPRAIFPRRSATTLPQWTPIYLCLWLELKFNLPSQSNFPGLPTTPTMSVSRPSSPTPLCPYASHSTQDISQTNKLRDHCPSIPVRWGPAGRLQSPQQLYQTANTYYGPYPIANTTFDDVHCENHSFQMTQDVPKNTTVSPTYVHPYEFSG